MSDEHRTRLCSNCYEPIDARARWCPHCGLVQWKREWPRLAAGLVPMLVVMILGVAAVHRLERLFNPPGLVTYSSQIKVAESRMEFGQSPEGPVVFVVGMLKNESDTAWQRIEMQAKFFDPQGKLIDVDVKDYYLSDIQPHGELAFKVSGPANLPRESYAKYEVFVSSARDARQPF